MKFIIGRRYWASNGSGEMIVLNRCEGTNTIRAEIGLEFPANYKINKCNRGWEYIVAQNLIYKTN